jgi:hypothetical protein
MKFFYPFLALFLSFNINASEVKLAVITSDVDQDHTDFFLETTPSTDIDSLRLITSTPSGQMTDDHSFPIQSALTDGIIVSERSGRDVIHLYAENFTIQSGGQVKLNYLYNGMSGSRMNLNLVLKKTSGEFALYDDQGKIVNRLFMVANHAPFVGVVGIREIQVSYGIGFFDFMGEVPIF